MKKIKSLILAAMLMLAATVSAKTAPIQQDRFFDETYIGITVGYDAQVQSWDWTGMQSGLRIGKWFTPQVGAEIEGTAQFVDFYKRILNHRVGINALVNLNYLNGYQGKRDKVEFVPFVGVGWQRNYDVLANYMYTKMGLQFNVNFNSGWQFNIIPSVGYVLSPQMQYDVRRMDLGLAVGVTYNFKNSHGTHYFAICDKEYSQAYVDELNAQVNELRGANAKLVTMLDDCMNRPVETKVESTTTIIQNEIQVPVFPVVGFTIGSYEIPKTALVNVNEIANFINKTDANYEVVGYASEEGPERLNKELSQNRANAVKQALINAGVNADKLEAIGDGVTTQFGNQLDLNRTVIIRMK